MDNKTFDKKFNQYKLFFLIIILLICILPIIFTRKGCDFLDFSNTGQIGDTIGGIMGPFVAIVAAALTFLAFWVQFKANEQQRQDIALERFENNLFELIHFHQEITNGLLLKCEKHNITSKDNKEPIEKKGRDIFQLLYENAIINNHADGIRNIINTNITDWKTAYLNCPIGFLDHYFRLLYRIFKYIDDSDKKIPEMTKDKKYEYTSIVRATLSQYELILLFYNCLSTNGNSKFKPLIEKYAILNNLRVELLATKDEQDLYCSKFEDSYLFSQDENRDMSNEYKKGAFVYNKYEN